MNKFLLRGYLYGGIIEICMHMGKEKVLWHFRELLINSNFRETDRKNV